MHSTGVSSVPLYEILEERGFEFYRVNARHTKNLPGRKSDVSVFQATHIQATLSGDPKRYKPAGQTTVRAIIAFNRIFRGKLLPLFR
jgi:hypothetical protein